MGSVDAHDQPGRGGGARGEGVRQLNERIMSLVGHIRSFDSKDGEKDRRCAAPAQSAGWGGTHPPFDRVAELSGDITSSPCPLMLCLATTRSIPIRRASPTLSSGSGPLARISTR